MTLPIERARSRRPITWLTLLGVLLLPALIGGILVTALYDPTQRLDAMTAAIVNEDEPVTIDGQYTPLGRQLAAGLIDAGGDTGDDGGGTDGGGDTSGANLTWVLSNADDAAAGLADGTYQAVVTIPANFSTAATSAAQELAGGDARAERATIEIATAPDALIVDDAITAQIAQAAATTMGQTLSQVTLENVFLGFTTLGDQLGEAAAGAQELADGAVRAADGAALLPDGAQALADGAGELSTGASGLGSGLTEIAAGTRSAATGAGALATGAEQGAAGLEATGIVPTALSDGASTTTTLAATSADTAAAAAQGSAGVAGDLAALAAACPAEAGADFCADLATAANAAGAAATSAGTAAAYAAGTRDAAAGVNAGLAQFDTAGAAAIAAQLREIASGARNLASALGQVTVGVDQSAAGAGRLAAGADGLAAGATELAGGATELANGVATLADGSASLASGLDRAVEAVPSYSETQAQNLAEVISEPVATDGTSSSLFGASAVPLLATLALWFGALASYVAMQAATRHALTSRRPSVLLALRGFAPGAAIGIAQGLLVAGVVQFAASYDAGTWWAFAGIAALAGVVFAAVNQALVAVFGGAGRWLAALVGVLAVATGVVSTVPGVLAGLAGMLPTAAATQAMLGVLAAAGGVGGAIVGLLVWGVLALVATTIAVAVRRTTAARAALA